MCSIGLSLLCKHGVSSIAGCRSRGLLWDDKGKRLDRGAFTEYSSIDIVLMPRLSEPLTRIGIMRELWKIFRSQTYKVMWRSVAYRARANLDQACLLSFARKLQAASSRLAHCVPNVADQQTQLQLETSLVLPDPDSCSNSNSIYENHVRSWY